ncbi:hypothetical protein [Xenorhabdus nematophila]|uniref:hypothetical protein n=1 Tax=Xenorhabdus nematophila TaxID=628 RepID=UPI000A63CAA7|nr:hypothetical protein [Xenorhabdus nematophila]
MNKTGCHANTVLCLNVPCPRASQGHRWQALCRPHPQNGSPLPKGKRITKSGGTAHHGEKEPLYCIWCLGKKILKVHSGVFSSQAWAERVKTVL